KPGFVSLKVVNPDLEESEPSAVNVISDPADLSISRLAPDSGAIGTVVTLSGAGFSSTAPSAENFIRFEMIGATRFVFCGLEVPLSADGSTLTFALPFGASVSCPGLNPPCPGAFVPLKPGQYLISIINPNGMSNSMLFQLTNSD